MIFLSSDLHLGHIFVAELRGFTNVEEMNNCIITLWNASVRPSDTIFLLGDLVLGQKSESLPLVGKLNGTKILILGNHDAPWSGNKIKYQEKWLPEYAKYVIIHKDLIVRKSPILDRYYKEVGGEGTLLIDMCHFPYTDVDRHKDKYEKFMPPSEERFLLHGHTHQQTILSDNPLQISVGVDAWGLRPVSANQLAQVIISQQKKISIST